jgi:hypothetical protein
MTHHVFVRHELLPILHATATTIGWVAAVAVLCAYALLMAGRTSSSSLGYLAVNAAGSAGLAVSMAAIHAWQSVLLNTLWLVFGVAPLVRGWRERLRAASIEDAPALAG